MQINLVLSWHRSGIIMGIGAIISSMRRIFYPWMKAVGDYRNSVRRWRWNRPINENLEITMIKTFLRMRVLP
jgi:hypothetical protein